MKWGSTLRRLLPGTLLDVGRGLGLRAPSPEALKAAILVISIVQILILDPFLQRYFFKGITLGVVKG